MELYHGLFAHFVILKKKPHLIFFTTVLTQKIFQKNQVQAYISGNLPCLTTQITMFCFIDNQQENRVIINHLLHIFKFNVHKSNVHKDLTVHY